MSEHPPLVRGLAEAAGPGADCGCCEGIAVDTPKPIANRPGLPAISYRSGRYVDFRTSQLARLSADEHRALAQLGSRENDDFTIALIDAWSCVCDVLTFYQERIANESWLGTATERLSIIELGRLIGYRPRPGVAATTTLVFTLDEPVADQAPPGPLSIASGAQVQSVPGPGETAQTFETIEAIEARPEWNALVPRQSRPRAPAKGDSHTWLAGIATGLKVGDAIVILGTERLDSPDTEQWDFRKLIAVTADPEGGRTRIEWSPPLGSINPSTDPARSGHRLYALRARASLFGWNAPHPAVLPNAPKQAADWQFEFKGADRIHLDSIQDGFVAGSWVTLIRPGAVEIYRIEEAVDDGRAEYAVSARVTRLTLDTGSGLDQFAGSHYRGVSVYGKSEELPFAEAPIVEPVMGADIALAGLVEGLEEGRLLAVRGRRAQAEVAADGLVLESSDDTPVALQPGDRVTLLEAPAATLDPGRSLWRLRAPGGFEGSVEAPVSAFAYVGADQSAETVAEVVTLAGVDRANSTHAELRLAKPLAAAFDRATALIHANVARATHGESTREILGDGNGAVAFQSFALKQKPLTFVSAANATGAASTLALRVDDILWHEVPALYGRGPGERVFEVRLGEDGAAAVQFGDGDSGARPPTGRNNVVAGYRKGIGAAGNLRAGTLTLPLGVPLGVKAVTNPIAATGGEDAQSLDSARSSAPVGTLTLGRVVSLRNYEQFAIGFAGIAKARADWVWDGDSRRIVVTVAAPGGAPLEPGDGGVLDSLETALRDLGDPFVRLAVMSFRLACFRVSARIVVEADYDADVVLAAVEAALRYVYGFDRRGFAPLVASSEVVATVHSVPGVAAVTLAALHRTSGTGSQPIVHSRLLARPVSLAADNSLLAAEILTLDPGPLGLEAA